MEINLHPNARTTPAIRLELQNSDLPTGELARLYNLHRHTVDKWRNRDSTTDASHRPHCLHTTLTEAQETLVVELRKLLLLPLDDLLVVTREFINPEVSRSGLDRCLRRPTVSNLKALLPKVEGEKKPEHKSFKDYDPGFFMWISNTCRRCLIKRIEPTCLRRLTEQHAGFMWRSTRIKLHDSPNGSWHT